MSPHLQAQKELDHLKSIIFYLERGRSEIAAPTSAVAEIDYWRRRIRAVLMFPNTPRQITDQASALLARLDRITAAKRECDGSGHIKAAA
ncbi:hypothetical protein [Paraburkholderia rhynchosiae]|uniref:Uncharacterized protein n=1 Tax=Paraburkholderia rhynchosiae TaxID=487049 RepID=A0A2N7WIU5_9BURK|nr:hypothetical protein [Paraburkholderia rhynchosiae]PMS29274.1 hypothetical protein C0Z16_19065 [Paraburkholderia rhynchosiae]CAB3708787.1 hypothetical protein LMG27174_04102 [Paraburkholderia rhynchosiae]